MRDEEYDYQYEREQELRQQQLAEVEREMDRIDGEIDILRDRIADLESQKNAIQRSSY